jgi:RNA polymerase sigma factor (sigma-70 family)
MEDWSAALAKGDVAAAWDRFLSRYRRLIFAAIRHYVQDYDDVMDVFARVCEALREDDFRRLRAYHAQTSHRARFSTWLVTVVRNLTIDWFRQKEGRRRLPAIAERLPPRQRRIFEHVYMDGHSHVEAYELIRSRDEGDLSFGEFLRELHAMYRAVKEGRRGSLLRELHRMPPVDPPAVPTSVLEAEERREIVSQALASLGPEDRVAVELYVLEELPAADVARIVGLPNAKAVYNRVYRALAGLREHLARAGIEGPDL